MTATCRAATMTKPLYRSMTSEQRQAWLEQVGADIVADMKLCDYERLTDVSLVGPRTAEVAVEDVDTGSVTRQRLALIGGKWVFRKSLGAAYALTATEQFLIATAA